jgi:aminopeptidase YwaD
MPARPLAARVAALAALAMLATLAAGCALPPPRREVAERVARINASALGGHVAALTALGPRPESDEAVGRATLDLLAAHLRAWGYDVREEPFVAPTYQLTELPPEPDPGGEPVRPRFGFASAGEREHRNLVAERRGRREPGTVVELGAHWDTVPGTVGADDNASGVAALLEVARACAEAPTDRTLRFCFYAHEERGLWGSAAHARAVASSGERLVGALVMDMVGFASHEPDSQDAPVRIPLIAWMPGTADFIFIAGNWDSGDLADDFEDAAERYVPALPVWGVKRIAGWFSDSGRSDHASYWEAGLPAILLSDTAEFRSPHYHRASDRPATLDLEFAANVARAACAWALEHAHPPRGGER